MPKSLEKILNKIVKYGLYAILMTPLVFWPRALYAFGTPKFILFQILVEIVFGAWLIIKIIDFRNRGIFDFENQLFLRKNYIALALVGFFAVSVISAFFGVDFQRSIWGIGARMTGLFSELHFLAWFLVLISFSKSNFRSPTSVALAKDVGLQESKLDFDIVKYLNFSFAISILVALTAFYQNAQWHLAPGHTIFSNPTFVAPYFLFHFFWGLYKSIGFRNLSRIYFLGGSILIAVALILGQVRGAAIGFLAGLLVIGVFLIFSDILAKKRYKIFVAALMLATILSAAAIFIFKDSEFVRNSAYLKRFGEISLSATTAQTRILTWQSALKDISLLGVGPENFNYLFNANYNPRLLIYGGNSFAETWQDKPHNAFIEVLAETGIIGALAYALIWFYIVYYLFKMFKKGDKFLTLSLAAGFIAYLGAVFFSFDSFGSWFGLYLFLALLILS